LIDYVFRRTHRKFDLVECEIKSDWLRNEKSRNARSPFLAQLTNQERVEIAELFYKQIPDQYMKLISVVIDKENSKII